MTQLLDGIQFPIHPKRLKPSSSQVGKDIIAAALANIDQRCATQISQEKKWRKHYPYYFKELVKHAIQHDEHAIKIAKQGLEKAQQSFYFYRDGQQYPLEQLMQVPRTRTLQHIKISGDSQQPIDWYVPYQGQQLRGKALTQQLEQWQAQGIIEAGHTQAIQWVIDHPACLDLSQRYIVLMGAGSEAGPLSWLCKWKANIIALDLANEKVWQRIITTVQAGNATLYAPSFTELSEQDPSIAQHLGVNLLTDTPEIIQYLQQQPHHLDLAAIAYLDGEKHVRLSIAMDQIVQQVCQVKPDSSLMYMCTPTDIYAIPEEIIDATQQKYLQRSRIEKLLCNNLSRLSFKKLFKQNSNQLITANNGKRYGIADCLVIEQGPNYALAKRIQQWRALIARQQGHQVSINIAPSTTTHSVTKNPLLKAAFRGAALFDVEAFSPDTTNALMAALWVHDLVNPQSSANPAHHLAHPLELISDNANHGGLWRVAYLARSALGAAAIYGLAREKLPF